MTKPLATIVVKRVFAPRRLFKELASDHVPFDRLASVHKYETAALSSIQAASSCVAVQGPVGSGKSSLIAYVCRRLPETHVALRVPVTGADDPTSVSIVAATALSQALNDLELEQYQEAALARARADTVEEVPSTGKVGGTLGGGPLPLEVHGEVGTLREQLARNQLAGDRLAGLDRLITILVARRRQPVFVLEDTEAAIGGSDREDIIDAFFDGPVRAFMNELEAPCLLAVQSGFAESRAFNDLAPHMHIIPIPIFEADRAPAVLRIVLDQRLGQFEVPVSASNVLTDEALRLLSGFYVDTSGSLRHALAAAQSACEYALDQRAARVGSGHVRAAIADWRARFERA